MKKNKGLILILLSMSFLLSITGCSRKETEVFEEEVKSIEIPSESFGEVLVSDIDKDVVKEETIIKEAKKEEQEEIEEVNEIVSQNSIATITSFGDTLCHSQIYKSAYNGETYDFSPIFRNVEKYFKDSTLNIGNCESPMAGKERGYSGYPCFNAPEDLALDLKELGVDIMTTANNHCLDKGFSGLESTIDFLDEAGISHVGTSRTEVKQNTILFKDLNGIKTAFLAYTYGTNGIPLPKEKEFCVNLIDEELIKKHIDKAKSEGAELIIVSMHWGVEYQTKENSNQDELAQFLIKNGVKIVLGCHPHVLQPMTMLETETEDGDKKEGLVIFSQGNFFSAQTKVNTRNTAIFNIEVEKDAKTNEVKVNKASYIPLYLFDNGAGKEGRYELLDLNEIVRSYEAGEEIYSKSKYDLAKVEKERCEETIGPEICN